MNRWIFSGRLGADAETRVTAAGKPMATFNVAVTAGYGDRQSTVWVKCVLFGKRAESRLMEYLVKGAQVSVSGELTENEWTAKDGTQRKTLEVRVDDLEPVFCKKEAQQETQDAFEDDVPF